MYRESTGLDASTQSQDITQKSVLSAWSDYLKHYNDGRGVVLIGHSEGAYQLEGLIIDHIDRDPSVRRLLVSAVLTGGNLLVGSNGSGPFEHVGACHTDTQTGCVVAYEGFSEPPPPDSMFGRLTTVYQGRTLVVLCTNPAGLTSGSGPLVSMYRTQLPTQTVAGSTTEGIFGSHPPRSSTPWIEFDGQYTGRCLQSNGDRILMVTAHGRTPVLTAAPTAAWGLHLDDLNLALGNLVDLVQSEATAYVHTEPASNSS